MTRAPASRASARLAPLASFALLLALALSPGQPAHAQADAPEPTDRTADWTVMVYLDADNDLEAPQMKDLAEMLEVGSSARVNVLVLADRHPAGGGKYSNEGIGGLANWTSAKLLRVEPGRLRELADWGEANLGDPAVLDRFLHEAARAYPARRYALVIGDHGLGWAGTAVDESSGGDALTPLELASALEGFTKQHGPLAALGFDSCLMSTLEIAKAMAPYASVMIASEELEPAAGWDYAAWLRALEAAPEVDGAGLGRLVVDSYAVQYRTPTGAGEGAAATLGVIALDRIAALDRAVARLAVLLDGTLAKGGRAAWLPLARARRDAESYGRAATGPDPQLFDLVELAGNVRRAGDPGVASAADDVIAATRAAVLHATRGSARPNASGLSLYFPPDAATLERRDEIAYGDTAFAQANRWYPFLGRYAAIAGRDSQQPAVAAPQSSAARLGAGETLTLDSHVDPDDLDEASFVLAIPDGAGQRIVGAVPAEPTDDGTLSETWDGRWFAFGDRNTMLVCAISEFEEVDDAEDVYWALVPARLRMVGTDEWLPVTLHFLLDFDGADVHGEFVYAVEQTRGAAREIDLQRGDVLQPMALAVDADGRDTPVPGPAAAQYTVGDADELAIDRRRVAPGHYLLGYTARDLAGNATRRFVPVDVDAE